MEIVLLIQFLFFSFHSNKTQVLFRVAIGRANGLHFSLT